MTMELFQFRPGFPTRGQDPQEVGEELERIRSENDDAELVDREVRDAAREEESVLHSFFEWDTEQAADLYQLQQARQLISSVKVVYTTREGQTSSHRAYLTEQWGTGTFTPTKTVIKDDDRREKVMRRVENDLRNFIERYATYQEVLGLEDVVQAVRRVVDDHFTARELKKEVA